MIDQGFLFRMPEQTQHGTVTVEFMNRAIEAEREACAKVCDEVGEVLKQALEALEVSTDWNLNATGKQGKSVQAIMSLRQAIAKLESQEPMERDWRKAPWGFGEKRLSTVEYSDIVSDGGLDPRNKFDTPPQRTWEGLTKEDKDLVEDLCEMMIGDAAFSTIDAILKGKNT
jgi:hypothetical protein